jgi:integrase
MAKAKRRIRGEGGLWKVCRKSKDGKELVRWVYAVSIGYDPKGRRARRYFYGETPRKAKQKADDLKARSGGTIRPATSTTVAAYLESWLDQVKLAKAPTTYRFYEQRIRTLALPNIGKSVRLDDRFGASQIESLYDRLRLRGFSADAIEKLHRTLRRAFNIAVAKGLLSRNPCAHVERAPHRSRERQTLDAEAVVKLLEAAKGSRFEALFHIAVRAALRPGEALALRWDSVDFERGSLAVTGTLRDASGKLSIAEPKAKSGRRIELTSETLAALSRHRQAMRAEGHGSQFVFVTPSGAFVRLSPFTNQVFRPLLKKAGLPSAHTMYDLRHSSISLFAAAGVHQRIAADVAGHSTTDLTMNVYSHAGPTIQREGVERVAALLRGAEEALKQKEEPSPVSA